MKKTKRNTVIDLFSGCGGLSFGLSSVGFEILLGVDHWQDSLKTFNYNHPNSKTLCCDINKLTSQEILSCTNEVPTLVVGGPPCQGFSISGPRNFYDERNLLYLHFIRIVKELSPEGFIIENVPGLASLFEGQIKDKIIEEFTNLGYKVSAEILNASDFGVPQNRKRIFFVGLKSRFFLFPEPTHSKLKSEPLDFNNQNFILKNKITLFDAISDLQLLENEQGAEEMDYLEVPKTEYQILMRKNSNKLFNHVATNHTAKTKEIISMVPQGGNYKNLPEHFKKIRNFNIAWTRLNGNLPSHTIDTGHRHHFHPTANRVPTVRECARIQSFPDKFKFLGTKTSQYKQVGNAVPPLLAQELGKELLKYFN